MIKVNSGESYLGREIRKWCYDQDNKNCIEAEEVRDKYYSKETKYKPNDDVYYFVNYTSPSESYRTTGSLDNWGAKLHRDTDKSPRNKNNIKSNEDIISFRNFMNLYDDWDGYMILKDNNLHDITIDSISTIIGERSDLLDKTVESFKFNNGFLIVVLKIN